MFFLVLSLCCLVARVFGQRKPDSSSFSCFPGNCTFASRSLLRARHGRVLANRVSETFNGYASVSTTGDAFSAEFSILAGEAWPRISEGVVIPMPIPLPILQDAYPISLTNYMEDPNSSISYTAKWSARIRGPPPIPQATRGNLYNGALFYLNHPSNYVDLAVSNSPKLPISAEVSIWNRYDNFFVANTQACARIYNDTNGSYRILSADRRRFGNTTIRAYYVLNISDRTKASMTLNTTKLFRHLTTFCALDRQLDVVEISVAAKGVGTGANGRFSAEIRSLGRAQTDLMPLITPPVATLTPTSTSKNNTNINTPSRTGADIPWVLIAYIIGAIATIIAAVLGVYLAQGKCSRSRNGNGDPYGYRNEYLQNDDYRPSFDNFRVSEL